MSTTLPIIERDSWLRPAATQLQARHDSYLAEMQEIESKHGSIRDYADGHLRFGWQRDEQLSGWWFREWLPAAQQVYIFGDFNDWARHAMPLTREPEGVWSIFLHDGIYAGRLTHASLYKIHVVGQNGALDRIPAYATRVVQDELTKDFAAQFWNPQQKFRWSTRNVDRAQEQVPLIIYEAHIGMAMEREGVGRYTEFAEQVLPQIVEKGYTALQIMAIAEHPYYGSFGYHVSSLFAPSSRFGTPEELKQLIDKAQQMGLRVIMDIVHSHYVKNINEGINALDGSPTQYSPEGDAAVQPQWDSMNYDYAKQQVRRFLLSNIRYWIEEYHFDGFRFDGVSSMIYHHHGTAAFGTHESYFDEGVNSAAIKYLTLANRLAHEIEPNTITIAEEVSGMPALCAPIQDGGVGFDYRLAMAIPDYWVRLLEHERDEEWDLWQMWKMMNERLAEVATVAYVESHDQAMVGDKTLAMRLMGAEIYTKMDRATRSVTVERGMALHKMIRLATITMGGNAYLNFMGNEFGHPEWIDFPRKENDWSYKYAQRKWSLQENGYLRYALLADWDREMIRIVREHGILSGRGGAGAYPYLLQMDEVNKTMAYRVADLVIVLNWHGNASLADYELHVGVQGRYRAIMSSDEARFGGQQRLAIGNESCHESYEREGGEKGEEGEGGEGGESRVSRVSREGKICIKVYNVSRSATIYRRE